MPVSLVPEWAKPLRPMEGVARKVVLFVIALSAVGWVLFVAGFGELVKLRKEEHYDYDPGGHPRLYFAWAASVVGPVLFLLAVLHALLWRWPSSAVGSVTALLGVVYVSAIGAALTRAGHKLYKKDDADVHVYFKLWFAGGLISCLFWAITQAMWLWYPVISLRNATKILPCKPLTGTSRKVVLPFIALSAVGWVVFVAGFVKLLIHLKISVGESGNYYWAWTASVAGLVLYILAVVHAVLWGLPSLIVGSLATLVGVVYVMALGHGLHEIGIIINAIEHYDIYDELISFEPSIYRLLFSGSFLASVFWAVVQAMWPWYATGMETEEETAADRQKLWRWIAFKPYRPLQGIVRKLVLIFIGLSAVGWIVFVAGFVKYIIKGDSYIFGDSESIDVGSDPFLYWGWTASIGGPVVYLLAVAHAVMWTRISNILGSITAILGMMYITAVTYGLVWSGHVVDNNLVIVKEETHHKLLFAGGFLVCLFWALVQATWFWYPYGTTAAFRNSWKVRPARMLQGIARKIALPLIALSSVGWIVFVVGFSEIRTMIDNGPWLFWAWAASVVGPVVFILAVVHAVLWKLPSSIFGSLTAILGMMYIVGIGFGMIANGIYFDTFINYHNSPYPYIWGLESVKMMLSGGLVSCTFWALVQAMWPWYSSGLDAGREAIENEALIQADGEDDDGGVEHI